MSKRVSPAAIVALKEALCSVYWYKADLRAFLQQCLPNSPLPGALDWDNYKRQIVSDLVDRLAGNQDAHLGDLTRLLQHREPPLRPPGRRAARQQPAARSKSFKARYASARFAW